MRCRSSLVPLRGETVMLSARRFYLKPRSLEGVEIAEEVHRHQDVVHLEEVHLTGMPHSAGQLSPPAGTTPGRLSFAAE